MDEGYNELLRATIEREGSSRRKLSFKLAEKTSNQQTDEYRSLGKYLSKTKPELPTRERAAILAVLLKEPRLALVSDRRRVRLAELAAQVAQLREEHDDFVQAATERMVHLEEDLASAKPQSARPSSRKKR